MFTRNLDHFWGTTRLALMDEITSLMEKLNQTLGKIGVSPLMSLPCHEDNATSGSVAKYPIGDFSVTDSSPREGSSDRISDEERPSDGAAAAGGGDSSTHWIDVIGESWFMVNFETGERTEIPSSTEIYLDCQSNHLLEEWIIEIILGGSKVTLYASPNHAKDPVIEFSDVGNHSRILLSADLLRTLEASDVSMADPDWGLDGDCWSHTTTLGALM